LFVSCSDGNLRKSETGDVRGPYKIIGNYPMPKYFHDHNETAEIYEDLSLYTDLRGHFHCIYHAYQRLEPSNDCTNTLVSAHAYSKDGFQWYTSSTPPYGSQIDVVDVDRKEVTQKMVLASRERPKLYFGGDPNNTPGLMTHMVEAVCESSNCDTKPRKPWCVHCKYRQWNFTLISTFDLS